MNATGFPADGEPVSDNASDDVLIIDVPITTTTDKVWLGGPWALPEQGTPAIQYPRSRIRVTTVNTTPARVDQMSISDPAGSPTTDPFDVVRLIRIAGITVPSGTTDTVVTLESNIYDVTKESLIWSSRSETISPGSINELMQSVIEKTVYEMRKQKVL